MRPIALLGFAMLLAISSPLAAKPKHRRKAADHALVTAPGQRRFLGKRPHGPLALAKGRTVQSPAKSACRTWGKVGAEWHALDELGRVVGKAKVVGMDRYDVTNCDELTLKTIEGKPGVGVHVSGAYEAAPIVAWKPTDQAREELAERIKQRDAGLRRSWAHDAARPLDQRMVSWKTPSGEEFAAVGGRALSVLRREGGTWKILHTVQPPEDRIPMSEGMYQPFAVLDMDGDGQFEIVVHENEGASFGDFTLTPNGRGYRQIEAGIYGSTA